jgi:hypothetical protein
VWHLVALRSKAKSNSTAIYLARRGCRGLASGDDDHSHSIWVHLSKVRVARPARGLRRPKAKPLAGRCL